MNLKLYPNGQFRRTNDFFDKAEILIWNARAYRFHLWYIRYHLMCKQFHFSLCCFEFKFRFAFIYQKLINVNLFCHFFHTFIYLFFSFAFSKHTHNRRYKKAESKETVNRFIFRFFWYRNWNFYLLTFLSRTYVILFSYLLPIWWCLNRCIRTVKILMMNDFGSWLTSPHFRRFAEFLSLFHSNIRWICSAFRWLLIKFHHFRSRFHLTSTFFTSSLAAVAYLYDDNNNNDCAFQINNKWIEWRSANHFFQLFFFLSTLQLHTFVFFRSKSLPQQKQVTRDTKYLMNFQLKTLWSVYCQQMMFNGGCMRILLIVVLVFVCFVGFFLIIFIMIVAVVVVVVIDVISVTWNDTSHSLSHYYRCCMRSSAEHDCLCFTFAFCRCRSRIRLFYL